MLGEKSFLQWAVLLLNCGALSIGTTAGPMLVKYYFGPTEGKRTWLATFSQTGGWPICIVPIWISSAYKKRKGYPENHVSLRLVLASIVLGLFTGLDNFMYAWGLNYLPLSTSALVIATQLGFNSIFAYLVVGQKFTSFSINAVILLTVGAVMLSFNTKSDTPEGVQHGHYLIGFFVTLGAAALYGLILPLIELAYRETSRQITYALVMEMQLIMSFSATVLCLVGMIANQDFMAIRREAKASPVGEVLYYVSIVANGICWQLFFIGVFGVIFLANSLLSGIIIAFYIPINQLLAVLLYRDKFTPEKAMALVLSLWGFVSYLYGEYRTSKKLENQEDYDSESRDEDIQSSNQEDRDLESLSLVEDYEPASLELEVNISIYNNVCETKQSI
ncbi:hypothetical protein SUGI_0657330 [Cryptomeria japonica]|uniref:purine permease 1 n=1 Tax=Cryptomeria japonica TaxID=3369 RepID=UPI002414B608|nr:purine permease 1 [Cryptomeria japonica]GLJ32669.1 hypothetical protein SUGI_0657330 [Cryptomeria japonica]